MCKSRAELEKAKEIVHRVMLELGLELAEDKTKDVDFHKDDFDFLGFTFEHIRRAKKSGKLYYILKPQDSSLKKFKDEMKQKIKKSYTFSNEQWCDILNSIIRGKFNYFLLAYRAMCGVNGAYKDRGLDCRSMCRVQTKCFKDIDGYIRNRLRINLGNRGKRHAGCLDGKMLTVKYDNKFFLTHFGLVSGEYLLFTLQRAEKGFPQTRFEDFLAYKANTKQKAKRTPERERFFQYALAR